MRQLCPNCSKVVDLPDDAAGREVACPACAKSFAVPKGYAASVTPSLTPLTPTTPVDPAKPTPPPGLVVPPEPVSAPSAPSAPAREAVLSLPVGALTWVPAIGFTVALVMFFFFSAVVAAPGGYRVFAQSPVQSIFATFSSTSVAAVQDAEKALRETVRTNGLMLAVLFGLLIATAEAWLLLLFPKPTLQTVPAPLGWLVKLWPKRHMVLLTFAAGCFALLWLQSHRGFSLESAIRDHAANLHAKELEAADSSFKKQEVEIRIGQDVGKFCLTNTTALDVALIALLLTAIAVLLDWRQARNPGRVAAQLVWRS
jgi:hypothetical protein